MNTERRTVDSELVGQVAPLLTAAVRVARTCFSDAEIIERVHRALAEAAHDDAVEEATWEASWPHLF